VTICFAYKNCDSKVSNSYEQVYIVFTDADQESVAIKVLNGLPSAVNYLTNMLLFFKTNFSFEFSIYKYYSQETSFMYLIRLKKAL
jgi:hypothetical protein